MREMRKNSLTKVLNLTLANLLIFCLALTVIIVEKNLC